MLYVYNEIGKTIVKWFICRRHLYRKTHAYVVAIVSILIERLSVLRTKQNIARYFFRNVIFDDIFAFRHVIFARIYRQRNVTSFRNILRTLWLDTMRTSKAAYASDASSAWSRYNPVCRAIKAGFRGEKRAFSGAPGPRFEKYEHIHGESVNF